MPEHNADKRGEFLVAKLKLGQCVKFTMDSGFGTLHADGLLGFNWLVGATNFTEVQAVFLFYLMRNREILSESGLHFR